MNRRDFLVNTAALVALQGAVPALAASRRRVSGLQLWTVARQLAADFEKTIAAIARLGYREIETYGPYDFSDPRQIANWKALEPSLGFSGSGFFGRTAREAAKVFRGHGLTVPSLHTDFFSLQTRMGELAEAAHTLGARYVTLPSLPADQRQTFDDYRRAADTFNAIGRDAARHGVRFGYHNHGYGLLPVDGKIPLVTMLDATDPATVFLELDIFWNVAGGGDPKDYLTRYKGRYKMLHLKDMKGTHRLSNGGGAPAQWIELFPYLTWLGDGSLDIKGIVDLAARNGAEHYFVEQDRADDVMAAIKGSADYLKSIGFR